MPRAFVIRPFGKKADSAGQQLDFDAVHAALIAPALADAGLSGSTTVEIEDAGNIRADMFALILEADLVVCDITVHNANVFYELGVRHALRRKGTVLIKGAPSADTTPFDLLTDRYLAYDVAAPGDARGKLKRMIEATLRGDRISDSPVFGMMPELPEVDPALVQALPMHFTEEVSRALASGSKGWLRLLAEDVQGRRFERAGLRMIGSAQWRLKDLNAARESLETIRDLYPNDVDASLALANIYERLAKRRGDESLFVKSDQSIERVLANPKADAGRRVEALALRGRNLKTIWRHDFETFGTVAERRQRAVNRQLRDSYAAYREAFDHDLNHFWSGLGAIQMALTFLELTGPTDKDWRLSFDSDGDADNYRSALQREFEQLCATVRCSIEAKLRQTTPDSADALWARVSQADLLFAEGDDDGRTRRRYEEVLRDVDPFAWDAVGHQLELFASLGVRTDLARAIIDARNAAEKASTSELSVIMFAGHQPDSPGRALPRFPVDRADVAKEKLRERLQRITGLSPTIDAGTIAGAHATPPFIGLASGAPGGDVLFHEVCAEFGIPSIICLPIPAADYVRETFTTFTDWRARFQDLVSRDGARLLELSDRAELPTWLADPPRTPPIDFWERGNRWVFAMARAFDAETIYLVTLWNGERSTASTGGTAHMVALAEATSDVRIERIDTNELLGTVPLATGIKPSAASLENPS